MQRISLMRHASGHRVRAAAHQVLLFVQKPGGMSGPARGPAKVLPLPHAQGDSAHRQRRASGPRPAFIGGLVVLGVVILGVAIVLGLHVGRQYLGSDLFSWFRV
jgi:hypothetical protein